MKFTILKNSLNNKLHNLNFNPVNAIKTDFHKISNPDGKKVTTQNLPEQSILEKIEKPIPKFISVSKLNFDNAEIHGGVTKDTSARGGLSYTIIEPTLSERDKKNFEIIKKLLMIELSVSLSEIKTKKAAEIKLARKIEPLMRDHMVEEISCDGTNIPLYIWHREFESIPTNIRFETDKELNNFARKVSYMSGKHVSMANPIVDAALPDGSRINLTLGHESTKRGSTFTIRRFRADPITIVDLIKFQTMSADIAAYLWYVAEKNSTMLVAGGTASGKTTALNALASFIRPGQKIVTIEDTQELNLPHENWIPAVSRQNFTDGQIGEINQYDLLRAALRQRPDIIIVGETRGREAYTLFQAMATGHGGFSSIHADSVEATLTRLASSPMDIPKTL